MCTDITPLPTQAAKLFFIVINVTVHLLTSFCRSHNTVFITAGNESMNYVLQLICDKWLKAYSGWPNILRTHTELFVCLLIQVVKVQIILHHTEIFLSVFNSVYLAKKNLTAEIFKKFRYFVTDEMCLCVIIVVIMILQSCLHNNYGLQNFTYVLSEAVAKKSSESVCISYIQWMEALSVEPVPRCGTCQICGEFF
jgi:hypothetical protein